MTEAIKYTEHVVGCCRNAAVQALEADNHYWQSDADRLAEAIAVVLGGIHSTRRGKAMIGREGFLGLRPVYADVYVSVIEGDALDAARAALRKHRELTDD